VPIGAPKNVSPRTSAAARSAEAGTTRRLQTSSEDPSGEAVATSALRQLPRRPTKPTGVIGEDHRMQNQLPDPCCQMCVRSITTMTSGTGRVRLSILDLGSSVPPGRSAQEAVTWNGVGGEIASARRYYPGVSQVPEPPGAAEGNPDDRLRRMPKRHSEFLKESPNRDDSRNAGHTRIPRKGRFSRWLRNNGRTG
jgi:hypothetical protein